nr:hypothetical protein [Tanacetum cinerariifolium]
MSQHVHIPSVEEMLRDVAKRMKTLSGKGGSSLEGANKSGVNVGVAPLGVSSTIESSFVQDPSQLGGDQSGVSTYCQGLINVTNVETSFGIKFTSLSGIDFFMSIKEGKYADILSTMSSADIDAAVNAIETIRKKFQGEVNKAGVTQLLSCSRVACHFGFLEVQALLEVSKSSPLVSPSTTINVPRELNSIDVAPTFGVPLTTVGDLHKLINDIEAGKHEELLSRMTNDDRMETLDALGSICYSIQANRNNPYVIPSKVSHVDDSVNLNVGVSTIPSDPIVQFVDINTKSTSHAGATGASAKDQPDVNSNFHTLWLIQYLMVLTSLFLLNLSKRNIWAKHELKRIMMNSKGFFFFKFDSRAGLEGVKFHDVPIQVFEEDGISLIATFIGKPVMLDSYTSSICTESWGRSSFARYLIEVNSKVDLVDVVTIGIPYLSGDGFTKETICVEYEWRPPICDICKIFGHVHDYCLKRVVSPSIVTTSNVVTPAVEKTNEGFQMVGKKKKRKGKSISTNGGQFNGPSIKQNIRYEPKATTTAPKKGATYVDEEEDDEEDVENVHDESINLIQNTKAGGSSSFTTVVGSLVQMCHVF